MILLDLTGKFNFRKNGKKRRLHQRSRRFSFSIYPNETDTP